MHQIERGLVVKKYIPTHKVAVLCEAQGKIILQVRHNTTFNLMHPGTFVTFSYIQEKGSFYSTKNLMIDFTPLPITSWDLSFMHHCLELCYYFIPLNQPAHDAFIILKKILLLSTYLHNDILPSKMFKKLCLCVFMVVIGFYPPKKLEKTIITIKQALLLFIDFNTLSFLEFFRKNSIVFSTLSDEALDSWLLECIQTHPRANALKTLNFMY